MPYLESAGLTQRQSKCIFGASTIEYSGHVIDADGLHPYIEKVQAILNAPQAEIYHGVDILPGFAELLH